MRAVKVRDLKVALEAFDDDDDVGVDLNIASCMSDVRIETHVHYVVRSEVNRWHFGDGDDDDLESMYGQMARYLRKQYGISADEAARLARKARVLSIEETEQAMAEEEQRRQRKDELEEEGF